MKIFTDGLFKIGSTHNVCEDYVHHGQEFLPFCVVSDGCSGSKNSDIGSRILAHSFEQVMKLIGKEKIINYPARKLAGRVQSYAYSNIANLGIPEDALHATLLFAVINPNEKKLRVTMIGDGVLALKMKDSNDSIVLKSDFSKDYPIYPGYFNNNELLKRYDLINEDEEQEVTHNWIVGKEPKNGKVSHDEYIYEIILPLDQVEWVMLASDGIDTFVEEEFPNRGQNTEKLVIPYFKDVKARQGAFVTRRINKMLGKELSDFKHEDDLSVAGISIIT
jgi:serine/threonine protein phosphatase PrpC